MGGPPGKDDTAVYYWNALQLAGDVLRSPSVLCSSRRQSYGPAPSSQPCSFALRSDGSQSCSQHGPQAKSLLSSSSQQTRVPRLQQLPTRHHRPPRPGLQIQAASPKLPAVHSAYPPTKVSDTSSATPADALRSGGSAQENRCRRNARE